MEVMKAMDANDNGGNTPMFWRYNSRDDGDNRQQLRCDEIKEDNDLMTGSGKTIKTQNQHLQNFFYQPSQNTLKARQHHTTSNCEAERVTPEVEGLDAEESGIESHGDDGAVENKEICKEDSFDDNDILKQDGYLRQILRDRIALFETQSPPLNEMERVIRHPAHSNSSDNQQLRSPNRLETPNNEHRANMLEDIETDVKEVVDIDFDNYDENGNNNRDNVCVNTNYNTKAEIVGGDKHIKQITGLVVSETKKTLTCLDHFEVNNNRKEEFVDGSRFPVANEGVETGNSLGQPAANTRQADFVVNETLQGVAVGGNNKGGVVTTENNCCQTRESLTENSDQSRESLVENFGGKTRENFAVDDLIDSARNENKPTQLTRQALNSSSTSTTTTRPVQQQQQQFLTPNNKPRRVNPAEAPYKVVTVTEQYIEPKKNIQHLRRHCPVRDSPNFCSELNAGESGEEENQFVRGSPEFCSESKAGDFEETDGEFADGEDDSDLTGIEDQSQLIRASPVLTGNKDPSCSVGDSLKTCGEDSASGETRRHLVRVAPRFCGPIDDPGFTGGSEEDYPICRDLLSTRRRSLSEGDLFFTNGRIFYSGASNASTSEAERSSLNIANLKRRKSLSCGNLGVLEEGYEEESDSYEEEEESYDEGSESYEEEEYDNDEATSSSGESEGNENQSIQISVQSEASGSPKIRVPRRNVTKKRSFIAKSISVDLLPQHHRYFSNIRTRRKGVVNAIGEDDSGEEHEFIADLIEFKKFYKKPKKGLRIARSVESFFEKSDKAPVEKTESVSSVTSNSKSKKKRFLSGLFAKNEKMEYLRETSILDDADEEVGQIDNSRNQRPEISIVEDSIKKVAGVIELYIDSHGDVIRKIEIVKVPGQSLGFFIRFGNGIDRVDGIFISRVTLGSFVDENNLMHSGDEILQVNKVDVTGSTLERVAAIMQSTQRLIVKTRSALPLPMNTSPLLRNYHAQRKQSEIAIPRQNYSISESTVTRNDDLSVNGDHVFAMQRTMSDPNQLNDNESDNNDLSAAHMPPKRDRSRSELQSGEHLFTRGRKYQSEHSERGGSLYNKKVLPPIPDARLQADDNNKSFSRAQRYQTRKSPPTVENERIPPTSTAMLAPPRKQHLHGLTSPKIFRRHENKKSPGDGKMLSAPSNESLSSTSDSEDALQTRLHVYPSDTTTIVSPLKSFTGKLVVTIYKLIGRLSGIDGDCYCNIEVDGESKATTQHRRIKELVTMDESFEIDLQKGSVLMFYIFHKHGKKQKLVSQACIHLQNLIEKESTKKILLLGTTTQVQMRIKVNFTGAESYLQRSPSVRKNGVFGFNLSKTLAKEENTIPIVVRKCVEEIEKRGLELTGIYRISGNARKKRQLRAQFEENSLAVDVGNEEIDCHILAGILKDYLRELPNPLISNNMYLNIYNKAGVKFKDQNNLLRELMKELPYTNRATLIYIMDHLRRVSARGEANKMTNQNLAVCFGPTMMSSSFTTEDAALDFKKQIDALEFLLNIWPVDVELENGI